MEFIFTSLILFNQLFIIESTLNELNQLYGVYPDIIEIHDDQDRHNGFISLVEHSQVKMALNPDKLPPDLDSVCGELYYNKYNNYLRCVIYHEYGHIFLANNMYRIARLDKPPLKGDSSFYAEMNPVEAFTEAFAEFHMYNRKHCYSEDCEVVKYIIETLY
jgi:hypothetical protein